MSFFCGVNRGRCPDLNASADLTEIFDLLPEAVLYSVMRIAKAGRRIAKAGRSVLGLRFSADSRRIHATGGNGRIGSVLIDPDALLSAAAPIAGRKLPAAEINNFILNGSARETLVASSWSAPRKDSAHKKRPTHSRRPLILFAAICYRCSEQGAQTSFVRFPSLEPAQRLRRLPVTSQSPAASHVRGHGERFRDRET